mgnify:CR=1 FL=1|tara:strand:- start:9957 stop:10202 length:246 start_codon:yes stop_codon:yes gene_type:complete
MKSWPKEVFLLVKNLNEKLKIDHNDWHKFKGNKNIRAAELISSALCQLIIGNNEKDTIDYLEESIKWLKGINVDKPCPHKN